MDIETSFTIIQLLKLECELLEVLYLYCTMPYGTLPILLRPAY